MTAFPREELDEMVGRWLEANERCEKTGDWRPLAEMYTEDATYGWHNGPDDEFMAVGRDEIREHALGTEMYGLDGWTYPYQKVLVDDHSGEIVGFWNRSPTHADPTAPLTWSPASAAAGSATRATGSGPGNATSTTSATPPPCSWK